MAIYFPKTLLERQVGTVTVFPYRIYVPELKSIGFLKKVAMDTVSILYNPSSFLPLSLEAGNDTKNTLLKFSAALCTVKETPTSPIPPLTYTQVPRVSRQKSTPPPRKVSFPKGAIQDNKFFKNIIY